MKSLLPFFAAAALLIGSAGGVVAQNGAGSGGANSNGGDGLPEPERDNGDGPADRPGAPGRLVMPPRQPIEPAASHFTDADIVFIIDGSAALGEPYHSDAAETRPRQEAVSQLVASTVRGLPPGRRFNLVASGVGDSWRSTVSRAGEPATDPVVWLNGMRPGGQARLVDLLFMVLEQGPAEVVLVVSGPPARPETLDVDVSLSDWLADEVRRRRAGAGTVIDVIGMGLDGDTRALFRALARAGNGSFVADGRAATEAEAEAMRAERQAAAAGDDPGRERGGEDDGGGSAPGRQQEPESDGEQPDRDESPRSGDGGAARG